MSSHLYKEKDTVTQGVFQVCFTNIYRTMQYLIYRSQLRQSDHLDNSKEFTNWFN